MRTILAAAGLLVIAASCESPEFDNLEALSDAGEGGAPGTCDDGLRGGNETGIDCGGDCAPCEVGGTCQTSEDCDGGICLDGVCVTDPCSDTSKNGAETDIDCGGSQCAPCSEGRACLRHEDCEQGVCTDERCQPPHCENGELDDGLETDIDCG
ncbi:MAG TPA: hypothetical protein VI197_29945, partial [Polyangiaceae bacterium]